MKSGEPRAADLAFSLLLRLQHRGQDGAGLSVLSESGDFESVRGTGLITLALKDYQGLARGQVAVAHTRYATTGTGSVGELQPFVKGSPKVAMAHNGNIVNTEDLIEKFALKVETASDLDVLQQVFLRGLATENFQQSVQTIFNEFNGSYAVVGALTDGSLFAFRDPFGLRPLFLAQNAELYAFASETTALGALGEMKVEEIQPGEWVHITNEGVKRGILHSRLNPKAEKKFCMFEIVYFSSPQAEYQKTSSYMQRFRLGEVLAKEISSQVKNIKDQYDYVVPVPDTSRSAAIAVAETLGIPYREFLVKNNYISRTFIMGHHDDRIKALNEKLSLIGPETKGKRILLVDDSVVRGNTCRVMALRLREAGVHSVGLASTCPPIKFGCFYGIDFPDQKELVAHGRTLEEIQHSLGVNSVYYITLKGLKEAFKSEALCTACLTGDYPTRDASFDKFLESRRLQRGSSKVL